MGNVTINFADVESFEPVEEGEYAVEIDKIEVRSNKAKDGEYLNWELVILDGDYENRRLWMITSLKPTALFRLKQVFEELGVLDDEEEMELEYDDDVEIGQKEGPRLLYPELEGMEATAVVKNEMYDGRERNRVESLIGDSPKKSKKRKTKRVEDDEEPKNARRSSRRRDEDDEDEEEAPRARRSNSRSSSRSGSSSRRRMR